MKVIFIGSVSKERPSSVMADNGDGGERPHNRGVVFESGQYCEHFSSQRKTTIFKPHLKL